MKYIVNEKCIGCGLCESLCPEVFKLGDQGTAFALVDESEDPNALIAKESCPVAAIEDKKEE